MKSFWISLLAFILLLCSCKSNDFAHEMDFVSKEKLNLNQVKYQALADTSNVLKIEIDKSKLTITEHIIITKYDKDTGAVTEKTETERTVEQDFDKMATEEETKGVTEASKDSSNHFKDSHEMVESEVKEEAIGGQESFGKWFGIVIGIAISVLFVYLWRKIRR